MNTDHHAGLEANPRAATDDDATPQSRSSLHIVMVTVHTSPAASPGSADAGGMNVVVWNTALALGRRGHLVDLVTRKDDPGLPDVRKVAPGVRLFHLDAGPAQVIAKSDAESLIEPFGKAMEAWWERYGADVDVIHSHHWFSGVACLNVARAHGVPHVQSYHSVAAPLGASLLAGEQPESAGRIEGERMIAVESDHIVAVSHAEKRTILDRYHPDETRITVVKPGVDIEQFSPRSEVGPVDAGYLFFAARLQPLKRPDLAIEAASLIEACPRLVIAGEVSKDFADYAESLHQLAADKGISDRVVFLGSQDRDDLAVLMAHASMLVNPSMSETFGLINLEAAACGIPVVAADVGGVCESVIDGQTGVLIDGHDPKRWAQVVAELIDDEARREQMGKAGREFVTLRTWDVVAAESENCYRALIGQAR